MVEFKKMEDLTEEEVIDFWAENVSAFQDMYNNPDFKKAYGEIEKPTEADVFRLLLEHNKPAIIKLLKSIDPQPIKAENFLLRFTDVFNAVNNDFFTSSSTTEQTPST